MTVGSLVCAGGSDEASRSGPDGRSSQAPHATQVASGPIVDILTGLRYSSESTAVSCGVLDGTTSNRNSTNDLDEGPLGAPFSPMEGSAAVAVADPATTESAELPRPVSDSTQDSGHDKSLSLSSMDDVDQGKLVQAEEGVVAPSRMSIESPKRRVGSASDHDFTPSPRLEIKSVPTALSPWSNRSDTGPPSIHNNRRKTISGLGSAERTQTCPRCSHGREDVLALEAELSRVCRTLRARNDEVTAREAQCELQQRLIADLEEYFSPQMRGDGANVDGADVTTSDDKSGLTSSCRDDGQMRSSAAAQDLICAAKVRIEQFDTVLTSLKYAANRLSTDLMERENAEKLLAESREKTERAEELLRQTKEYACSLEDTISKQKKKMEMMSKDAEIAATKIAMAERQAVDLQASRAECAELQRLIQRATDEGQRMQQEAHQARATTRTRDEENRVLKARLVEALHRETQKSGQLEVIENKIRMGMFENQIPPDEIDSLVAEVREWSAESRRERGISAMGERIQVSEGEYTQLKETVSALETEISQKNSKLREFGLELESVREYMKGISEVFTSLNVAVPPLSGASSKRNSIGIGHRPSSASSDDGELPWGSYASQ